jgi:hypothetical protein
MLHLATQDRPDPIAEEEKSQRISASDSRRTADHLETDIRGASPFSSTELVEVVFNETAHGDTIIRHKLAPTDPEGVKWIVANVSRMREAAPTYDPPADPHFIYQDGHATHKPWSTDYIVLRSNIPNLKVTLLLGVPR